MNTESEITPAPISTHEAGKRFKQRLTDHAQLTAEQIDQAATHFVKIFAETVGTPQPKQRSSPPLLAKYKQAAEQIGDLFCWCVQNLSKFPPLEGEWIDEVKKRLRAQWNQDIAGLARELGWSADKQSLSEWLRWKLGAKADSQPDPAANLKVVIELPDGSPVKFAEVCFTEWCGDELHICAAIPATPQPVIEGAGLNKEQQGYWRPRLQRVLDRDVPVYFGCDPIAVGGGMRITDDSKNVWDVLHQVCCDLDTLKDFAKEVLPPPQFIAPPKPEVEQVLVRFQNGNVGWLQKMGHGYINTALQFFTPNFVELLNPQTGEPSR